MTDSMSLVAVLMRYANAYKCPDCNSQVQFMMDSCEPDIFFLRVKHDASCPTYRAIV